MARLIHPSVAVVRRLCLAWAVPDRANMQAEIIVRALAEAGMLKDCTAVPNGLPLHVVEPRADNVVALAPGS